MQFVRIFDNKIQNRGNLINEFTVKQGILSIPRVGDTLLLTDGLEPKNGKFIYLVKEVHFCYHKEDNEVHSAVEIMVEEKD